MTVLESTALSAPLSVAMREGSMTEHKNAEGSAYVSRLLAGEVNATELGDRVVAVLEEDAVVELLGPAEADPGIDRLVAGDVELADELVEEQPSEALG